jgi:hypothetical protein
MLWPIKFIKGARPGLKRPAQVTSDSATNAEKRFKYEKEKRPERIFNAKWCEGRPWLKYDRDENVMTCTICTKYGKRGETGNLNNYDNLSGCPNTCRLIWNKNYMLSEISVKVFRSGRKLVGPTETDIV